MELIKEKVQQILGGTESKDSLRYYVHSSHDTQLVNAVAWLNPVEHNYLDMPFTSTLISELHYNETCLLSQKDTSCFTVQVYNNGTPLKFDTCIDANMKRGSTSTICQYDDFVEHINRRKINGDLTSQCFEGYSPYPQAATYRNETSSSFLKE
jgi:hypothetical protein